MEFNYRGIYGYDVSFYQDNNETPQQIDFRKMKESGASFVIIKAGQNTYKDPDFDYNWREAKLTGLPRACYWFLDKHSSPQSQAHLLFQYLSGDLGEGLIFVDFEKDIAGEFPSWQAVYDFLSELILLGIPKEKLGVYTGYYFWVEHGPLGIASRDWFAQFPLWIAWYADVSLVHIPPSWTECLIWQDGTPAIGLSVGVESREIDHDKFNGDIDKFKLFFGSSPVVTPPGGNVAVLFTAELLAGKSANVREGAGTGYPIINHYTAPTTANLTVEFISDKTTSGGYDWYQTSLGYIAFTNQWTNLQAQVPHIDDKPVKITIEMESGKTYVSTTFNEV